MANKDTLTQIKRDIEACLGQVVELKTNKGRKNVKVREGVVEDTFPSIFTVKVDCGKLSERRISYSYCDILTETVEVRRLESLLKN